MLNTDYLRFMFSIISSRVTNALPGLGLISILMGVLLFLRGTLSIESWSLVLVKPIEGLPEVSGLIIIFGITLLLGNLQNWREGMITGRLISKLPFIVKEACTLGVSLVISLFFCYVGYNLVAYSLESIPKNFFLSTTSSPILLPSIITFGVLLILIPLVHRITLSIEILYYARKLKTLNNKK